MNKIRHLIIAAAGLCLASCSILNGNMPVIKRPQKQEPTAQERIEQIANSQEPAAAPADTAAAQPQQSAPTKTDSKLVGKIDGEWIIIEAGGVSIKQDEDMPYLIIEEKKGRFYASNGCNILNGDFAYDGATGIKFSHVLSTMMLCPDIKYEQAINNVIRDGSTVRIDIQAKGSEWYMRFRNAQGQTLMTLRKHNLEVINGLWQVTEIGDNEVDIPDATIFFDIPELTVNGNTGCNHFNGIILIDPQVANSISFASMGATMRMCPNSEYETAMLVALEQTTNYLLSGHTLRLLDSQGDRLITLKRPQQ